MKDLPPKFLPHALDFQKNIFAVLNGKVLLQISRTSTSIFFVMCKQHSSTVLYVKMAGRLKKLQCNILIRMYICSPYNAFTLDIVHPSFCSRYVHSPFFFRPRSVRPNLIQENKCSHKF